MVSHEGVGIHLQDAEAAVDRLEGENASLHTTKEALETELGTKVFPLEQKLAQADKELEAQAEIESIIRGELSAAKKQKDIRDKTVKHLFAALKTEETKRRRYEQEILHYRAQESPEPFIHFSLVLLY